MIFVFQDVGDPEHVHLVWAFDEKEAREKALEHVTQFWGEDESLTVDIFELLESFEVPNESAHLGYF